MSIQPIDTQASPDGVPLHRSAGPQPHRRLCPLPVPSVKAESLWRRKMARRWGRWWYRGLVGSLATLGITALVLVANGLKMKSRQMEVGAAPVVAVDHAKIAQVLADCLAVLTISSRNRSDMAREPFHRLHEILRERFPRVHQELQCETVNELSLLYRWPGEDPSLEPILLMSHLDVVPVDEQSLERWTDKSSTARIHDGYVWGRGALDVKCGVVGMLSAVEHLVTEGFRPQRTVYLAMGHDEEVGGNEGNGAIAERFKNSGTRLAFVLDEGGAILTDIIPGIENPVAFVAIAEKRYAELKITARGEGGHGSMPGQSAIVNLAECIRRIEQQPMPTRMTDATATLFDYLGPEMPLLQRTIVGNRSLFERLLTYQLSLKPSTAAVVRTTINVTQVSSDSVANQNATGAEATLNARLLPGDSVEDVCRHVRQICEDIQTHDHDSGESSCAIECEPQYVSHGELVSSTDCDEFRLLQKAIHQVFPDVTVAAGLTSVSTDSAWYYDVTDKVYRFIPMRVNAQDVTRIHGIDERIGIENLAEIVRFYIQLLQNTAAPSDREAPLS